jgi:hypothetical protein
MAKPDPVKPAESKPTLVSVESTASRSGSQERKGSNTGLWILGALVLVLGAFALWQSQQLSQANERIATLEDRVLGLDSQLWAAQTQIQTYEMQRGLVREAVTDISDRMTALREMVGALGPHDRAPRDGRRRPGRGLRPRGEAGGPRGGAGDDRRRSPGPGPRGNARPLGPHRAVPTPEPRLPVRRARLGDSPPRTDGSAQFLPRERR